MKARVNRAIEKLSKKRLEDFELPVIAGCCLVVVASLVTMLYFIQVPVSITANGRTLSKPLGHLLWKARINRQSHF